MYKLLNTNALCPKCQGCEHFSGRWATGTLPIATCYNGRCADLYRHFGDKLPLTYLDLDIWTKQDIWDYSYKTIEDLRNGMQVFSEEVQEEIRQALDKIAF